MVSYREMLSEIQKDLNLAHPKYRWLCKEYLKNHQHRYVTDLNLFEKYYKGGRILEIGSFPFHITYCLKKMGYKVDGLDIDPSRAAKFAKKHKLNVKKCDVEKQKFPFKSNSFDFVLFCEIFEHLRINPIATLQEINRVLKPGGMIMLTTPNLYSLPKRIMFNLGMSFNNAYSEFEKLNKIGHMGHIREYSTKEVKQFLTNTGFRVTAVHYDSYKMFNRKFKKIGPVYEAFTKIFPKLSYYQIVIAKK